MGSFKNYPSNAVHLEAIAFKLEEWATYQESGMAGLRPFEVRFRIEAASDIMEQAQDLLKGSSVHVAAPVVLAGACLEEFLRSMQNRMRRAPCRQANYRHVCRSLEKGGTPRSWRSEGHHGLSRPEEQCGTRSSRRLES